jgi:hypothetical protein
MRIPEALVTLDRIRKENPKLEVWLRQVTAILDEVWTEAYEEGKNRSSG